MSCVVRLYESRNDHLCCVLRRASTAIFHGGVTTTDAVGSDTAPLPFPVSKGQLKSRPAHASGYPLDNKEAKLMSEQSRLDQLRKVHDRMVSEIDRKEKAIAELQRKVADRELVDKKNAAELQEAEDVISKLQKKLEAIEMAVARAERDGQLFKMVLKQTERNPPNDPAHLARIDKVIMTVEAELVEAQTTEKVLEFELKHLTHQELPQLKVCCRVAVAVAVEGLPILSC